MSNYLAPYEIIPIFNPNTFLYGSSLTLSQANNLYLQLIGGSLTGPLITNSTIKLPISSLIIGSTTMNASSAQLNYNIVTPGTGSASKSLVLNSSSNISSGINNLTLTQTLTSGGLIVNGSATISLTSSNVSTACQIWTVTNATALSLINNSVSNIYQNFLIPVSGGLSLSCSNSQSTNTWSLDPNYNNILNSTQNSTSKTSLASIQTAGGISCAQSIFCDILNASTSIAGTLSTSAQSNITSLGTLTSLTSSGIVTISNTTDSNNLSTGAFQCLGGGEFTKSLNIGLNLNCVQNITSNQGILLGNGSSISASNWGLAGLLLNSENLTCINTSTANNGTVAHTTFNSFGIQTFQATNTNITSTKASTIYIAGPPTASTNITITNNYSLYNNSGIIFQNDSTNATNNTSGSIQTLGGIGVAKTIYTDTLIVTNSTQSTNTSTGCIITTGGIGCAKTMFADTIACNNTITGNNLTATSLVTGNGGIFQSCLIGSAITLIPLYVSLSSSSSSTANYGYLSTTSVGNNSGGTGSVQVSAIFAGRVFCPEFDASSDLRIKKNIKDLDEEECINFVKLAKPKSYEFKDEENQTHLGFIAQDILKTNILDDIVSIIENPELEETIDEDGFISPKGHQFSISYNNIIPINLKCIQYLLLEIEKLKKNNNNIIDMSDTTAEINDDLNLLDQEDLYKLKLDLQDKINDIDTKIITLDNSLAQLKEILKQAKIIKLKDISNLT